MRNDFISFFSYLSACDGVISAADAEFINEYFHTSMNAKELKEYIITNNTYSETYEKTISISIKKVVEYLHTSELQEDDIENSVVRTFEYDKDLARIFEIIDELIKEFSEVEGSVNNTIKHAGDMYIKMLREYEEEFEELKQKNNKDDSNETLDDLLNELNSLTGLSTVKQEINSLIHLQTVRKLREKNELKIPPISNHLVFYGNSGTGKTTVACVLAKIYKQIGVLSKGQLIEVDRADLIGGYVGQTALKVKSVIESALGGILFIDEAYALSYSENQNDYGQEAIETLLKAMEDNREDLIVIVAGYPDLMKKFINSNPGLRSRFSKYIHFPDYNETELDAILNKMCVESDYVLSKQAEIEVQKILKEKYEGRDKNFANAREVRNLYESLIISQADRIYKIKYLSKNSLMRLEKIDVDNARNLKSKEAFI